MAKKSGTVFQALDKAITGNWNPQDTVMPHINAYDMSDKGKDVIYRTNNKEDYLNKKLELQQNKYLKDRWVKANVNLSVAAYAGLNNVKLMYRDADLMDAFPEIGAALDMYAEESCLYGDTRIKLLNGEIKTIEELCNENYKDFWVYAVDSNGVCKPSKIKSVLYKGEKPLYKITLDDGTEIKCTYDHKWMLYDKSWRETKDLISGDSLMSIYERIDYKGYEKIKSTTEKKFIHTHRIVAENILRKQKEELSKINKPFQKIVIHHKSFNKLNNEPSELVYMFWNDHQKLHTDLNSKRWGDLEFSTKMRKIFSQTAKKMWRDEEMSKHLRLEHSKSMKEKMLSMSKDERNETFGRKGEKNGMYGVHRLGRLNPNYDFSKQHIEDINLNEYIEYIVNNPKVSFNNISSKFNINKDTFRQINKVLCKKYGLNSIKSLRKTILTNRVFELINDLTSKEKTISLKFLANHFGQSEYLMHSILKENKISLRELNKKSFDYENICDFLCGDYTFDYLDKISKKFNITKKKSLQITKEICKIYGIKTIKELKYVHRKSERLSIIKRELMLNKTKQMEEIGNLIGLKKHELLVFVKKCGYEDYKDFRKSLFNHRIISIEELGITGKVYDLLDSSVNSCYGVKCNNGLIISHNCITSSDGNVVNVYSKSDRIKSILQDLFVNRLNVQLTAPMIIRAMCKYGNQFMLLDVDNKNGVKGWKQMPVFNVERIENGIQNPYGMGMSIAVNGITKDNADMSTQFVWLDDNNSQIPFRDWQIAHFRLLTNSLYLPYGVSALNAARRHWRMLSLMEDMMLIYRLERSVERRVYKIFVGAIDDADVQAYVEQIANQFKRTPIIDPMTGQVDLRKNILSIDNDIFLPVRDENAPTPIDTLSAGQNLTAMDDIKFVQNKMLTALRIPKSFLNFEENAGDGKNLALMDIRFTRLINRIQQAFLMELTKVASIHLFLLGFNDELNNFTLSMNNPSTQAEGLEIENMQKKIDAVRDAVSDPGNGLPVMSQTRALKQIMKWSEKEIKENLEEIRLEKGIAAELEKTTQIIKKTGIFDTVDRIYGEPGAEYQDDMQGQGGMGDDGGMGGGGAPPPPPMGGEGDMGGDLGGLGAPGDNGSGGDIAGAEGSMPTQDMGNDPNAPMESVNKNKPLITENIFDKYLGMLDEKTEKRYEPSYKRADIYDSESLLINEEFDKMIKALNKFVENDDKERD